MMSFQGLKYVKGNYVQLLGGGEGWVEGQVVRSLDRLVGYMVQ